MFLAECSGSIQSQSFCWEESGRVCLTHCHPYLTESAACSQLIANASSPGHEEGGGGGEFYPTLPPRLSLPSLPLTPCSMGWKLAWRWKQAM